MRVCDKCNNPRKLENKDGFYAVDMCDQCAEKWNENPEYFLNEFFQTNSSDTPPPPDKYTPHNPQRESLWRRLLRRR